MLSIEDLLNYAENLSENNENIKISLLFVTRHLKPETKTSSKVMDKYEFRLVQAPITPSISIFFKELLISQIRSHSSKDNIEMKKYSVIDDDLDNKIYTYAMNNALAFSKIINENIKSDSIPELKKLLDIQKDLWAYCIKIWNGDSFTYSFRKMSAGKVTTNIPNTKLKKIAATFDKKSKELREFDGSVINFDNKIDCIYINNEFYVFYKKSFEAIVGLEKEFTEAAQKTLKVIRDVQLISGLEIIEEAILHRPSMRKILATIAEKRNHEKLNNTSIESMNNVLNMFQDKKFKKNGKGQIIIETEADAMLFLRLLNDYYKQGMTTLQYYQTDSGSVVNKKN